MFNYTCAAAYREGQNYAAADARAPGYVDEYMGENTIISFAPNPPVMGKESIRAFVDWQWNATTSITHSYGLFLYCTMLHRTMGLTVDFSSASKISAFSAMYLLYR